MSIHDAIRSAQKHAESVERMIDNSGLRSLARHADAMQRMINQSSQFLDLVRVAEQHAAYIKSVVGTAESIKAGMERSRNCADLCIELKWPPPWHMPARVLDKITEAYRSGKLNATETEKIFISFYTEDEVKDFGEQWAKYAWLSNRIQILREGIQNHIDGRHYSSVCVLLPQIDGCLREALGKKPTR